MKHFYTLLLILLTVQQVDAQCTASAPVPNDACYQSVIAMDPYCCNTMWDGICQSEYDACAPSGTGPCTSITPLIGCGTSTGASMSGTGSWDLGTCGYSTPGAELIFSFTATASGVHSLNITSISGGYIDFMWVNATAGCSTGAGWNCISDIAFTGNYGSMNWIAGETYYILLDPEGTGSYDVTFNVDCPNPGTPATASDCNVAIPVCTNLAFQIDPSGYGTVNELCTYCTSNPSTNPSGINSGCLLSGELNSTWFTVNVLTGGSLEFSFGAPGGGNCFDWIMWDYSPTTCASILANTLAPVRCNWNSPCDSYTGISGTVPAGGYAGNFQPPMAVASGDQYIICFSNYSSALTSVPLNFFGTADISCTLLPVEITSFQGTHQDGYNSLTWDTGAEINSAYFNVERSADGQTYQTLIQIPGAGNDMDGESYRTEDYSPEPEITYYRLKHVDNNGGFTYSDPIAVLTEFDLQSFKIVSAYPNPASDQFHIQVLSPDGDAIETGVMSVTGTPVLLSEVPAKKGINILSFPVDRLAHGVYVARVKNVRTQETDIIRFTVE